jgi:peptidyl-prolyl cis-trans isomerase SurA
MTSVRAKTNRKMTAVRALLTILLTVLLLAFSIAKSAHAEVIDRIVATVNGHVILQSDWNDAVRYEALLNGRNPEDFNEDDRRAVLDRLIDQELLGEQMKSAFFAHCTEAEAAAQVVDARKKFPEAATDEGWQALLARFKFTEKDLIAHAQQQTDLMRLVDAHLRPEVQIDSKTIEAYYREKFVPQLKQSGSGEIALADVSGKIRELLTQEKVSELLVSWLQTLRSEGQVNVPGGSPFASQGVQTQ